MAVSRRRAFPSPHRIVQTAEAGEFRHPESFVLTRFAWSYAMLVRPPSRQRGTFARSVAAASIAIAASLPQFLNAQQPAPAPAAPASDSAKTHTVKRGDTLWDIAKTYLGDAFLWPEIYRLNTGTIEDPHWIFPGEQLKLPGDHATVVKVVAVAAPDTPAIRRRFRRRPRRFPPSCRWIRRWRPRRSSRSRSCRRSCTTRRRRCSSRAPRRFSPASTSPRRGSIATAARVILAR